MSKLELKSEKCFDFITEEKDIQKIDYTESHKALINLAAGISSDDEAHGLACAVYAWMPTILKKFEIDNFGQIEFVKLIKKTKTADEGRSFLEKMNKTAPLNNSWVGTSKLLYFLNPEIFPIWDSRVAKNFVKKSHYSQYNKKEVYIDYFNFIHKRIDSGPQDWLGPFLKQHSKYDYTNVRCFELLLFLHGNKI